MTPSVRAPVIPRSPEWAAFAKAHLLSQPECIACGPLWKPPTPVQVHHIFPVHFIRALGRPDLELDSRNVVTLCSDLRALPGQDHHLILGHLDDFEAANPATRADAERYRGQTAAQIRASASWRSSVLRRLPTLEEMSFAQKHALRALMDKVMPLAISK
jgi:hypothetical protein